jgi:hypothetical protein
MKASHLGKVITYFDPMSSLKEEHRDWFVERADSPLEPLKIDLLYKPSTVKLLFSGHTGSGKSSELNRLVADPEIQQRFIVVQFSVKDELNIVDLSYTDVLVAIGRRVFEAADDAFGLEADLKKSLDEWAAKVSRTWGTTDLAEAAVEGGIKAWFFSAVGKLKTGFEEKREFRLKLEPRVPELIDNINRIVHAAQTHPRAEGKSVLLIIEDLDKPPVDVARDLFVNKSSVLVEPVCRTIFTIPTSVLYSGHFNAVRQYFSAEHRLPSFKTKERDGSVNLAGRQCMEQIIYQRMDRQLIEEKAAARAVEMSGGVARELVRMISTAANQALVRKANHIRLEDVEYAVDDARRVYSYSLTKQEYVEVLKRVNTTGELRWAKEEPLLELLHGQFILLYPNGPGWYGVNPIVHKLIGI